MGPEKGIIESQETCPEVFKLDDDSQKAKVVKPEGGPEALIEEAVANWPVSCIKWE